MDNQEINELLDIEKKVLKIYNKLIQNKLSNNKNEYKKEFNNLNLLLEYEDKKIDDFIKTTDELLIDYYLRYNKFDFNMFNSEVLTKDDLFRYRLVKNLVNKRESNPINDNLSEEYIKYLWTINKEINANNIDKITKIQYYICYLDKTVENFYLDNMYCFNKPYENIRLNNDNDLAFRLCKIELMDSQLDYLLSEVLTILRTNPDSEEYIFYKSFIKCVLKSVSNEEFRAYIDEIKETRPPKLMLLYKVLGD